MTRQEMIDHLVESRMMMADNDKAVHELLEEAFRFGRVGYDQYSDSEIEAEVEEMEDMWHEGEKEGEL